ncbi:MAG: hypothetical protein COZ69_13290 [Deltaproteobacteria bacterium CG_4_8_14_3_um_filter_45_9]|nr:MAG: hypothetical protein COZ69_13290 [Deltaproteobacteria bacterium CG_4_8_14_3_um_filter_45_9]
MTYQNRNSIIGVKKNELWGQTFKIQFTNSKPLLGDSWLKRKNLGCQVLTFDILVFLVPVK